MSSGRTHERLIGAWRLSRFSATSRDGSVRHVLGKQPRGQISYGADGHMSAHLWPGDAEPETTMPGYIAYYGRFSLDDEAATITHHVDGASQPGLAGTDQHRGCHLDGDRLTLSAEIGEARHELVWLRLGTSGAI